MWAYAAAYSDRHGTEPTVIYNNGHELRLAIRDVTFAGRDFDSLVPLAGDTSDLSSFTFCDGCLCACALEWEMPMVVCTPTGSGDAILRAQLDLGGAASRGGLAMEVLTLTLDFAGQQYCSRGTSGWFEDELNDIHALLPSDHFIRSCINCQFSDYSPYGHGLFGWMMCFRNIKDEYQRVGSKADFWKVHDRYEELVQETFVCDEFMRRVPGTGYRG